MKLLFLPIVVSLMATGVWYDKGQPAPDTEWRKSQDGFGAWLILTSEPEEFLTNWDQDTVGVEISAADSISVGEVIVGFVIFSGCKEDEKGHCNTDVAFKIMDPNGEALLDSQPMELWRNKPPPPEYSIQLSVGYAGFEMEETDQVGEYEFSAVVRDLNAGIELSLVRPFEATS